MGTGLRQDYPEDKYGIYRTIGINIVDYRMFEDSRYHHTFAVREQESGELLSDVLEIHFMELKKLPAVSEDDLTDWLQFINAEEKGAMELLAKKNEEIREAVDTLKAISRDREVRDRYFSRQMAIHDAVTNEKHARETGRKEGILIGEENGQYKAGVKLVMSGMKIAAVAAMLDLDEERLRRLLNHPEHEVTNDYQ